MATSKKVQRAASAVRPDPAPFQALVDQGKAPLDVVLDAYGQVLGQWAANGGTNESTDTVVRERPVINADEAPTLDGLLIQRHRDRQWAE